MKSKVRIWLGVGAYLLTNIGSVAIAAERTTESALGAEQRGSLLGQAQSQTGGACRAVAVTGGGEGGGEATPLEGGEGGEGGEGTTAPVLPEANSAQSGEQSSSSSTPSGQPTVTAATVQFNDRQLLTDFVDQILIPNYRVLTEQTAALSTAINAFTANPNTSTLQAARQAWLVARSPWEQSEAFVFGPAASLGYDADLDNWPLNEVDVKAVLDSPNSLTADYVSNLQTTQKGFHAIAFLLFGSDNNKQLRDFTQRDLQYLPSLAAALNQTTQNLLTSWTKGVNGNPPYRDEFVQAGTGSAAYPTMQAAAEEIVQGIIGILDELGNTKIGEAFVAQNPFLLESRFANSSLRDFENNLQSVQNVYLGQFPDAQTQGKSLSQLVSAANPTLDAQIQQQIQTAAAALKAVPTPIEKSLCDPAASGKIKAAQDAILVLFTTFQQQVLPLVQN